MKNVCQTCLLDLVFNLPTQVRDAALGSGQSTAMPQSIVGRDYVAQQNEALVASGQLPFDKVQYMPMAQKLARPTPYYERNKAHVCSFFLKGTCTRGDSCPYRHEQPKENNELANQNIKDRYHGTNDPVAQKILKKLNTNAPQTPTDTDIKTVYVGNVDTRISEQDLRDHFYYYGEISSVKMNPAGRCAFVEFTSRDSAEEAVAKLHNNLIVNGIFLRIDWAKAQQSTDRNVAPTTYENYGYNPATGQYNYPPPPPGYLPPPGYGYNYYPSMNPQRMGAIPQNKPNAAPGASAAATPAANQGKKQARDESAESAAEQPPQKKQKTEHAGNEKTEESTSDAQTEQK
jgi:pre-mRNA-splicing factor RBM22/SLT11